MYGMYYQDTEVNPHSDLPAGTSGRWTSDLVRTDEVGIGMGPRALRDVIWDAVDESVAGYSDLPYGTGVALTAPGYDLWSGA